MGPNGHDGCQLGGGFHFSSGHLMQIDSRFCRALHVYFGLGASAAALEAADAASVAQIEGVGALPSNGSVHAALLELMQVRVPGS